MSTPSILVTRRLPPDIEAVLARDHGAVLNAADQQLSATELRDALQRFDVVLCTLTDPLDARTLDVPAPATRLLANFGAGVNHIDLEAARARGMIVTNTPGVLTDDTADLTMLLLLGAARRATEGIRQLHDGTWPGWHPTHLLGRRVSGASLGIVGFGRIGQAVARRARDGFGMTVQYHSRTPRPEAADALGATRAESLEALLRDNAFVTLHCPATPETRHLIDAAALRQMRPGAILVNTARGDVVDEAALLDALRDGRLGAAGLDVFEREPLVPPELLALPNVLALPHLGSATVASREAMGARALRNIRAFLAGEPPPDRVV